MRIRTGPRATAAWLGAAALSGAVLAPAGAVAEEQMVESVGAVALDGGGSAAAPREAALEAAVRSAVLRVARDLLPGGLLPPEATAENGAPHDPEAWLGAQLGRDLRVYATQYSILEDRGERPAMFSSDPSVEFEYVVLASVGVDAGAVADHLAALGLLEPGGPRTDVILVLQGLESYQPVAMLQRLLRAHRGVRSAVPLEFSQGRVVLSLAADRSAREIVSDLERSAPPGLQLIPVELGDREATLLVDWRPTPGAR